MFRKMHLLKRERNIMAQKCNIFCCSTVCHVLMSSMLAYRYRDYDNILMVNITSFKGLCFVYEERHQTCYCEICLLYQTDDKGEKTLTKRFLGELS